jgi:general secretion pathway protein C
MDRFFRKYQWVFPYVGIAVATALLALIANQVIASQLAPLTVPKLPNYSSSNGDRSERADRSSGPQPDQWADRLSSRCLFGCPETQNKPKKCPGGCEEGEKCEDGVCVPTEPKQKNAGSDVPVESDLEVKLVGCMVADNPKYSLAMVQNDGSQQTYIVGPGDYLPEDSKVIRIKRDRIYIKRNGQTEYIRLNKTIGGAPSPTSVTTRPGSANNLQRLQLNNGGRSGNAAGGSGGETTTARQTSQNRVVVKRDSLEKQLANPEQVAQDARFISNFQNGERQGVKMVGVVPSGLFGELGFETGDVVHSIGGQKLTSKRQARTLLDKLEQQDKVDVVVERDGSKVNRQFVVE